MIWCPSLTQQPVKLPVAITCQTLLLSGYLQAIILKYVIITTTIIICDFATYSRQLLHCTLLGTLKFLSAP